MFPPLYIKISFRKIIISLLASIWKAPKTFNDKKFCKEPKTIIIVDQWLRIIDTQHFEITITFDNRNDFHLWLEM